MSSTFQHLDYYPFGMLIQERSYTATAKGYRFGFQGQEGDDEVNGEGNSYAFKYRIHDSRLGRFLSIDPMQNEYPHNSPYSFSQNKLLAWIEFEGLETFFVAGGGNDLFDEGYAQDFGVKLGVTNFIEIEAHNSGTSIWGGLGGMWRDAELALYGTLATDQVSVDWDDARYKAVWRAYINIGNSIDEDDNTKTNLTGYSYGSVIMAQAAIMLVEDDEDLVIDNLVLIGSTIDKASNLYTKLEELKAQGRIGEIHYEYTEGDEVLGASTKSEDEKDSLWWKVLIGASTKAYEVKHIEFGDGGDKGNTERQRIADKLTNNGVTD